MHKKLGVFQRLEFSIYAAEMATRNALRLENPDGADSGSWAELGRVRWPKAAEDLEALLELKRGIRLGTLSRNAAVRAQAASYDHATVILDEIQFDLENQC